MTMPSKSSQVLPAEFVPLWVPELYGNEWNYVKDCLDSSWISTVGSYVDRFERAIAEYLGNVFTVATVNGTAALHVALLLVDVQPDDEVLVPALSFIAPTNAVRYVGAWPVFIDAEPVYWQMDPEKVTSFLEKECHWVNRTLRNKTTGRRVKAILPVHILGHPCDMKPILEVARKYDLMVIEDAAESLGTKCRDRMVGSFGDVACFSFNGNKLVTTGGGGMIVTENEDLANRARYLIAQAKDDHEEFSHGEVGYNYRLTNIHAAIGVAQMENIKKIIEAKRNLAARYEKKIIGLPGISTPQEAGWALSTFWLYTILIDEKRTGITNRTVQEALAKLKIETRRLWKPVHEQSPYQSCQAYEIEVASRLHSEGLCLPSSVGLREEEQNRVVNEVCHLVGSDKFW